MKHSKLGFGVTGDLPNETVIAIAKRAEALGFHSLWFNDTAGGDALARIAAAASVTTHLVLATGVIPVDRRSPGAILRFIDENQMPTHRMLLGIGSSARPSPLSTVRTAIDELRLGFDSSILVGSLGPKMRQLGATEADGLLFNWLTPEHARSVTQELTEWARAEGRTDSIAATYIRTALGEKALSRLESEAAKYSGIPSYAANFTRLGISAMESAVFGREANDIQAGIASFDGTVDIAVVRAITATDAADDYLELMEAVACS